METTDKQQKSSLTTKMPVPEVTKATNKYTSNSTGKIWQRLWEERLRKEKTALEKKQTSLSTGKLEFPIRELPLETIDQTSQPNGHKSRTTQWRDRLKCEDPEKYKELKEIDRQRKKKQYQKERRDYSEKGRYRRNVNREKNQARQRKRRREQKLAQQSEIKSEANNASSRLASSEPSQKEKRNQYMREYMRKRRTSQAQLKKSRL